MRAMLREDSPLHPGGDKGSPDMPEGRLYFPHDKSRDQKHRRLLRRTAIFLTLMLFDHGLWWCLWRETNDTKYPVRDVIMLVICLL
jgi:hypothetical protein